MEKLFEELEAHCLKHLEDIESDVDNRGGFKCPQQIDDMKDLLQSIKDMHKILAMAKKTVV